MSVDEGQGALGRGLRRAERWRSSLLLLVLVGFAAYLMSWLWPPVQYFFSGDEPAALGETGAYKLDEMAHNRYVTITGLPALKKASYDQLWRSYKVYQLMGARVFVRERLLPREAGAGGGEDDGGYQLFYGEGRLLDMRAEPEYGSILEYFRRHTGFEPEAGPTWVLLQGVRPGDQLLYPVAFGVIALAGLFNLFLLIRRIFSIGKR